MRTQTAVAVAAALAAPMLLSGCGGLSFGTHEEDRSYDVGGTVTALKVRGGSSRVEIVASDSPGITIRERHRWSNDHNKPKAQHGAQGGTLSLSYECATNVIGINRCGVSYRIQVPRSTTLEVDNGDGAITLSGLSAPARLTTGSGSITATDLRTSALTADSGDGTVRISGRAATATLNTDTGAIIADGLTADRLTARSGDGRIKLTGSARTATLNTGTGAIVADGLTADRLTAHAGDGGIAVGFAVPPTDVKVTTGTGSVRMRLPDARGQGYAITMKSDNGAARRDSSVHHDSQSPRHVFIKTGDGSISVIPA